MLRNFTLGIQAYFKAFGLISELKLWKYFAIPMMISFITALIIFGSAYGLSGKIGNLIAEIWIWEWGKDTFAMIGTLIGAIIIVSIGLILYKHIIMAFSAPFMSPVSEKLEAHLTGRIGRSETNTTFSQQLWRGIRINSRNLVKELLFSIPILLLKFIPVINIFSTILLFIVQAYYAGFGNMDYTLERHFNYRDSVNFVRKHRGLAIGNGTVFILFLLIPVIGVIFVLPFSVTAASTETIKALELENLLIDEA